MILLYRIKLGKKEKYLNDEKELYNYQLNYALKKTQLIYYKNLKKKYFS